MIGLIDFYPWIYLYAQLNPKFPRLRMPNVFWDQMDDSMEFGWTLVSCRLRHMFGVCSIPTIQ